MTNYEEETLKNIERNARHGLIFAQEQWYENGWDEDNKYIDFFQHILDEVGRIYTNKGA